MPAAVVELQVSDAISPIGSYDLWIIVRPSGENLQSSLERLQIKVESLAF
jgi:hypothetical protein